MTPAGTSNELDVQNGWEENTTQTQTTARRACAFFYPHSSRRGHLVLYCIHYILYTLYTVYTIYCIHYILHILMQFVRTSQFKHKHLLALSTEDAGAPRPPRPEPLYIYIFLRRPAVLALFREGFSRPFPCSTVKSNFVYPRHSNSSPLFVVRWYFQHAITTSYQ